MFPTLVRFSLVPIVMFWQGNRITDNRIGSPKKKITTALSVFKQWVGVAYQLYLYWEF